MSLSRSSSSVLKALFGAFAALGFSLVAGCGLGTQAVSDTLTGDGGGSLTMSGVIHGAPNPVQNATVTLYTTTSGGYGATATAVTTASTNSAGGFTFTLPTNVAVCPAGEYAYVGAYQGNTGSYANNPDTLLMVPIGACSTNFTTTGSSGNYTNTYNGPTLWIDELTTVASAYALSHFMTVTNAGVINIGAPANNHATASAGTAGSTGQSAAGLAHAFATALALVNNNTGQANAYTNGGTSASTGGVIPDAELFTLGNILQACVNSAGTTATITATSNDGSGCGMLFSLTTPPQSGASVPKNTLQAIANLAKYPNPSVNTWNTGCTAAGSGSTTATSCLFNMASSYQPYAGALTSAPPDWALAVVYTSGYGAVTSGCSGTCPGLTYPYYVALDYEDNVFVLNWSGGTPTWTNIVGLSNAGGSLFSSAEDTTNTAVGQIATDTAGHVFGANGGSASGENVPVYYTGTGSGTAGALATTATYNNVTPKAIAADPFNNIYIASSTAGVNLRKLAYTAGSPPSYAVSNATVTAPADAIYQIAIDANYDFYELEQASSTLAYLAINTNASLTSAPVLNTGSSYNITASVSGSSTNAAGIAPAGTNAYVIDASGATPLTKGGSGTSQTITPGTSTALPGVYNGTLYSRYAYTDGNSWVYSPDGANGSAATGITVFDSTDTLALGTYKGCYVISKACGTTAGSAPMYSPRGAAIDSAGNIWVVSGSSADLTELIGAAAPTWPGLSMAKFGLPQ